MKQKLTGDQTILLLITHLEKAGWSIDRYCLGKVEHCDIIATKSGQRMMVAVNGSKSLKGSSFDIEQIKSHFGDALIQTLDNKKSYQNYMFAIAHPDNDIVRESIAHYLPELEKMEILHIWIDKKNAHIESGRYSDLDTLPLSALFINRPGGGILRGDPHLWQEMKMTIDHFERPKTVRDFEILLNKLFFKLTGEYTSREKQIFVERYNKGGMSSGYINSDYWSKIAFEVLKDRFLQLENE